jgi:ribonuclease G
MSTELIINASLPETRIAMMENGEIQELLIERASGKGIVGNIYKGRVTRVLPGMQAAFVDIGLEKAAFLYVDDVYVHSEIWEEEEGANQAGAEVSEGHGEGETVEAAAVEGDPQNGDSQTAQVRQNGEAVEAQESTDAGLDAAPADVTGADLSAGQGTDLIDEEAEELDDEEDFEDEPVDAEEDEEDDDHGPVGMGPGGDDEEGGSSEQPEGTIAGPSDRSQKEHQAESRESSDADASEGAEFEGGSEEGEAGAAASEGSEAGTEGGQREAGRRRHRRGRRGGKFRRRDREGREQNASGSGSGEGAEGDLPESYENQVSDQGLSMESDRTALGEQPMEGNMAEGAEDTNRPEASQERGEARGDRRPGQAGASRPEFREQRGRDRRIKTKQAARPVRTQVNIQDLLKEGQEVIVQVAKDPIATKGARLTCHISLPGRHLVCMPTIDHVGVSRRIERDDERRKLREYVERYRPKNLGFIVRTASGKGQSEKRIKQDIEYLTRLWNEIREKAASVTAPALVYEDLNSVLRAIRDWVTEDIDKIIVDSRYHYNEIQKFVSHFMPALKQKVELYHGDIPIFDAYGISTELSRALERKVWLKSGGYIVIDQAEALVAIDVNTGRYVGKKNLEDTILKTNLEAVQEIAYQLRLRNCGGIIILDLIDMEKEENKQRVYRALEEALKKDRARPSILKISELGLVEMTRKRTRDTMVRALCESCTHCEGKGFIKSKQTVAYEALREIEREGIEKDVSKILVQAHADVIDILAIDERETMDQLERRYRKQIYLQAVMDFHPEQFEISGDKAEGGRVRTSDRQSNQRSSSDAQRGGSRDQRSDRSDRSDRNRDRGERDRGREGGGDQQERSAQQQRSGGGDRDRNDRDRGRDRDDRGRRGRDRDRGRDRNRNRDQQGMQNRTAQPIAPRAIEGAPAVGAGAGEMEDPDSQSRFLGVIEKRGYASPEQGVTGNGSAGGEAGAAEGEATQAAAPQQDFYDEEDRLAFLRAQAAQDAALAKLRGADGNAQGRGGSGPREGGQNRDRGDGGGRGGRNQRRGRRGRRGSQSGGQGRGNFQGGGQQRFNNRDAQSTAPSTPTSGGSESSTSGGGSGDQGGSGGGNPGGGSSGHSQPPV